MQFKSIEIKNFRNFEEIKINLNNKNIFFGLNDVGKSNFLCALRYVFDRNIRKNGLVESDFHTMNIQQPVEILIEIDISDISNPEEERTKDTQKVIAAFGKGLLSSQNSLFIKMLAKYDVEELSVEPCLFYGGDVKNLIEMGSKGSYFDIDHVFNLIYIDSYTDLEVLFKKNIRKIVNKKDDLDASKHTEIQDKMIEINSKISELNSIKNFIDKIQPKYNDFDTNNATEIAIRSEFAVKGLYSSLVPYLKIEGESNHYPTSGDGRRKILSYSIFELLADEVKDKKINIFLIEEPENHLHRAMQIEISKTIFEKGKYPYLFLVTHSPYIVYEVDEANLVRIYNETKINSSSSFYKVPLKFKKIKRQLNRGLSEAMFADRVLLVEGPSEQVLFEKILSVVKPNYEATGLYILAVNGIAFDKYYKLFKELKIEVIVKTDNDLQRTQDKDEINYHLTGINRIFKLTSVATTWESPSYSEEESNNKVKIKKEMYNWAVQAGHIKTFTDQKLYLSEIDLETDLEAIAGKEIKASLGKESDFDLIKFLNKSKHYNMVDLIEKIEDSTCIEIYNADNFKCLKALTGED